MKLGTSLRFLFPTSPATHERSEACGDSHAANPAYAAAFSPLPAAARLMGVTGDMPIGMVLLAPFYHPLLLAEQIRTLAAFADGPLIVTFVAEGDPPQFRALGMEERSRVSWIGSPLLS